MELDQALQALQALYSSHDKATIKQANDWLTKFQQTPAAWQVSDTILSRTDLPLQFRFFAAQTMRTKVQFDFYELPAESYNSLRDSLLSHIDRFRAHEFQPIHTMLAIALADLAIQMDVAWPDAVQTLFARFGQNPDSYSTLLEVLRMLPEENMNYKLMTDTYKRNSSRERLQQAATQVVQFLLTLQCPTVHAKKKVLECFLSWIKFAQLQPSDLSQNPLIPECFKNVTQGGELSEPATDIIIEILRMSSLDLNVFQPLIQVILSHLDPLRQKFQTILSQGVEQAVEADQDGLLQICRIYVEVGECLIPLIIQQIRNVEVLSILRVILQCTDLPCQEISSIPFDFWQRLANEISEKPETDMQVDQFQGIFFDLLGVVIHRCTISPNEDPFQVDDDAVHYRQRLRNLADDCLKILTPNSALEHVLKSLLEGQAQGVVVQEAHFFVLATVGPRAEVRAESVMWQLMQGLPPLVSKPVDCSTCEGVVLQFTKKTSIELLGGLSRWLRKRPDLLRSALEMISSLLLEAIPADSPPHVVERQKQVQQSAAAAFEQICHAGGKAELHDLVPQLTQLFVSTMALPINTHLHIVKGVGLVIAQLNSDDAFQKGLEQLVMPLVNGITSEQGRPEVLSEILDRLTTIIRHIKVQSGSANAAAVGSLVSNGFWPVARQCLQWHPNDSKVVEKSCRLMKHSMRCVPDHFKPLVPAVATTLVASFQTMHFSSYLYSADIIADTYYNDPEVVPVLKSLFHQLSTTALQCFDGARDRLETITELVEDFYLMIERYLRHVPMIVIDAPTLLPTLQLWLDVIFVQQKEALGAVIAFILAVFEPIGDANKPARMHRWHGGCNTQHGPLLRPHALQVAPGLVIAIFKLIAQVPTRYMQENMHDVLEAIRAAFPQEFPSWLEAGLQQIPPSAASQAEKMKLGEQLLRGDNGTVYEAVQQICYRCEQVALRDRGNQDSTTGGATKGKR